MASRLAVAVAAAAAGWALARHAARPSAPAVQQPREPVVLDIGHMTDGEIAEVADAAVRACAACPSLRAQFAMMTLTRLLGERLRARDEEWLFLAGRFGGQAWEVPDDDRA